MTQRDLFAFDNRTGVLRPCARTGEATSQAADAHQRRHGHLSESLLACLEALRLWELSGYAAPTTRELAQDDPALVHQYGRRLTDLLQLGLVARGLTRPCRMNGRIVCTWFTVRTQEAA